MPKSELYERDFYAWTNQQAALLRVGALTAADIENIAEEIESMGKTEKRELVSRLTVLLLHLLKWQFQATGRCRSWMLTIKEQRGDVLDHLADRLTILFSNRRLLSRALFWAAANWLLDASCLWVILLALGQTVSPIDLLVAYGLANILAAIPITPGGLGVVEFTLSGTLAGFGVPASIAYLAVIAWRLLNFWLPIPLGGLAYTSLRVSHRRRSRLPEVGGA